MLKTPTDYNDRNDAPLSNEKIQEAIHKVVEEGFYYQNETADTLSHTPIHKDRIQTRCLQVRS